MGPTCHEQVNVTQTTFDEATNSKCKNISSPTCDSKEFALTNLYINRYNDNILTNMGDQVHTKTSSTEHFKENYDEEKISCKNPFSYRTRSSYKTNAVLDMGHRRHRKSEN